MIRHEECSFVAPELDEIVNLDCNSNLLLLLHIRSHEHKIESDKACHGSRTNTNVSTAFSLTTT